MFPKDESYENTSNNPSNNKCNNPSNNKFNKPSNNKCNNPVTLLKQSQIPRQSTSRLRSPTSAS